MFDLGYRIKNLILFVQDNKGTDDSWNPSAQCEDKDNQYRSAAFVDDGKGWKMMERMTLMNDISVLVLEICRKVREKI